MTMEHDPAGIARAMIDVNSYLTIATTANPVRNRADFICSRCETDAPIRCSASRADPAPDSLVADEAAKRQ